jgi:hypothetical protein
MSVDALSIDAHDGPPLSMAALHSQDAQAILQDVIRQLPPAAPFRGRSYIQRLQASLGNSFTSTLHVTTTVGECRSRVVTDVHRHTPGGGSCGCSEGCSSGGAACCASRCRCSRGDGRERRRQPVGPVALRALRSSATHSAGSAADGRCRAVWISAVQLRHFSADAVSTCLRPAG